LKSLKSPLQDVSSILLVSAEKSIRNRGINY
jgi:hypothetical protein